MVKEEEGRLGGISVVVGGSFTETQRYDHTFSTEFLLFLPTTLPITLPEDGRHSLGCFRPALTPIGSTVVCCTFS
jgi:hypothetical protein